MSRSVPERGRGAVRGRGHVAGVRLVRAAAHPAAPLPRARGRAARAPGTLIDYLLLKYLILIYTTALSTKTNNK